jgi:hypothetical protein
VLQEKKRVLCLLIFAFHVLMFYSVQGLAGMRSDTLSSARVLVIRHFLKTETTSVGNFGALLEAVVEMDIDGIHATGMHAACQEYVKLILHMDLSRLMQTSRTSLAERGLVTLLKSMEKNSSDDARDKPCTQAVPK